MADEPTPTRTHPVEFLHGRLPCLRHKHESVGLDVCVPAVAEPCRIREAARHGHRWVEREISSSAEVFCSRPMLGNEKFPSIPIQTICLKEEVPASSDGWLFCWKTKVSDIPACNWAIVWNQVVRCRTNPARLAPTCTRIEHSQRNHRWCWFPFLCAVWNSSMALGCNRIVPRPKPTYPLQWWWTYPTRPQIGRP